MQTPFESAQQNLSIVIQNWIAMNLIMEMYNLAEVIDQEQKDLLRSLEGAPEHKKAEIRNIIKKNKEDKELFIKTMTNNVLTDKQMWN